MGKKSPRISVFSPSVGGNKYVFRSLTFRPTALPRRELNRRMRRSESVTPLSLGVLGKREQTAHAARAARGSPPLPGSGCARDAPMQSISQRAYGHGSELWLRITVPGGALKEYFCSGLTTDQLSNDPEWGGPGTGVFLKLPRDPVAPAGVRSTGPRQGERSANVSCLLSRRLGVLEDAVVRPEQGEGWVGCVWGEQLMGTCCSGKMNAG